MHFRRLLPALFVLAFLPLGSVWAACSNPTGQKGEIIYNKTHNLFQGCMADDTWQALHSVADPIYIPNAVMFANATDYIAQVNPVANSKNVTISAWLKKSGENGQSLIEEWVNRFFFGSNDLENVYLWAWGLATGDWALKMNAPDFSMTVGQWHHILISLDVTGADPSRVHM